MDAVPRQLEQLSPPGEVGVPAGCDGRADVQAQSKAGQVWGGAPLLSCIARTGRGSHGAPGIKRLIAVDVDSAILPGMSPGPSGRGASPALSQQWARLS